jgi:GT2 family glycosyltransferase
MHTGPGDAPKVARVLVGLPAYRGAEHIAEALCCIREQEFAAFEVLISVDDGDRDTARACEPFLADPRFRLVMQPRRLGWEENINWLMAQPGYEFFCYWQQDDVTTPDYLGALVAFADAHPSFVCAFSDVVFFEDERVRLECPSLTGFALTRALYFLETLNGVPFRGLIRKAAIDRAGPIRRGEFAGVHEDYIWLAKLAREGKLGRVAGPTYFKRRHKGAASEAWMHRDATWRRAAWIELGVGMLDAILPAVAAAEREVALSIVLERLCAPRGERFFCCGVEPAGASVETADAEIIRESVGFWLERDAGVRGLLHRLRGDLARDGTLVLNFRADEPAAGLLTHGWSHPEPWGTWSAAATARLRLPIPDDRRRWTVALACRAYAEPGRPQTVRLSMDGGAQTHWQFDTGELCDKELSLTSETGQATIEFHFPDAVSPHALGRSNDNRPLALALISVTISPAEDRAITPPP